MFRRQLFEELKNTKKLLLVRHGQSIWNHDSKFTGWTNIPLTQKGKDELVTENGVIIPTATPTPSTTSVNDTATAAADTALARVLDVECMEMPDIEERQLRNQVMELRDRYYNILQSESANGINDSSQSMPNLPVNLLESNATSPSELNICSPYPEEDAVNSEANRPLITSIFTELPEVSWKVLVTEPVPEVVLKPTY